MSCKHVAPISLAVLVLCKINCSIKISKPSVSNVEGLKWNFKPRKTFKKPSLFKKVKFDQIRAGRKFNYRQNASVSTRAKHV